MHNGDYTAVDQLISRKRAAGHFREHPDFPGNPDYVLYYVAELGPCEVCVVACMFLVALSFLNDPR